MKVKIKKLIEDAKIPSYSKEGDAGMDLTATSKKYDEYGNISYGTGIAVEIPKGYVGLLFPRSSNSKTMLTLTNSAGIIDSGYRGEVLMKFKGSTLRFNPKKTEDRSEINEKNVDWNVGDRIGQLIIMPYPKIEFQEVQELSESERGSGGYGSTGK